MSPAQTQNVAVMNFDALGMAPAEAAALTERFRSELFLTKAYTVLERDRMEEILTEQGFQQTGCTSNECMVAIGQLLNVRQIFAGSVSQFGNLYTVMIRLVDIESGKIVDSYDLDFSSGKEKMMTEGMHSFARYFSIGKTPAAALPGVASPASPKMGAIVDALSTIEFIQVPGGIFDMGSTIPGSYDNEKPVHQVKLFDFYLGRTEVTVAQYRRYCRATKTAMPKEPPWGWREDEPVVNVDWNDAVNFCKWAGCRLPTEAEWEYAARSGGKNEIWAGTSDEAEVDDYIWYGQNSNQKANSVAAKRPNGLGLYDMSGNVWEWCADAFVQYSEAPQVNPAMLDENASTRVWRSGSYLAGVVYTRCARRAASPPGQKLEWLGFRVAKSK